MSAGQAHSSPSGAAEHSSWKGVDLATNLPRKKRDVLKRYGLALALAALALLIRGVLPVPTGTTIYQLPLAAVVLSGWIGGRGPGLLASLISVLGVLYWFIPPLYSFHISPDFQLPVAIFIGLCVLLTEVGEARSRVKRALEESEGRFRLMAETVPEMLWFQSVEPPEMLYVSPRYEEIWGHPFGDLKSGTNAWLEAVHPEERDGVRSAYERWLSGEGSGRLDVTFRIVRPDGETRWIHSRGTLIRDKQRKAVPRERHRRGRHRREAGAGSACKRADGVARAAGNARPRAKGGTRGGIRLVHRRSREREPLVARARGDVRSRARHVRRNVPGSGRSSSIPTIGRR